MSKKIITPESVTNFFKFKLDMRIVTDRDGIIDVCQKYGMNTLNFNSPDLLIEKKKLYTRYLQSKFQCSPNLEEHEQKIEKIINQLVLYLAQQKSQSILWVGGSVA